jgi:hypothetical protein
MRGAAGGERAGGKRSTERSRTMKELSLEQKVQRALDIAEVQNVMSKHAYYHGVGYHLQELEAIWVKADGPHAATASFGQNHGYWVGMERIWQVYGELNERNRKRNLGLVSQRHPEVENARSMRASAA